MIGRPAFTSFDVSSDFRRSQVRARLRVHGDWIQRSLWLAIPIGATEAARLAEDLTECVDAGDRFLVHRPCLGCLGEVSWRSRSAQSFSSVV